MTSFSKFNCHEHIRKILSCEFANEYLEAILDPSKNSETGTKKGTVASQTIGTENRHDHHEIVATAAYCSAEGVF